MKYTSGKNWKFWINKDNFKGNLKFVKCTKTNYGYKVNLMTNYITLYTKYIYVNEDNSAKIVTKVDQNYRAKYQYTLYHDLKGNRIDCENNTRKELKIYKELRK
jgi:hypothetical protein